MEDTNGINIVIDKSEENQTVVYCCGDKVSQWLQELFPSVKELIGESVRCKLVVESAFNPNIPFITRNNQHEESTIPLQNAIANVFLKSHSSSCSCIQFPDQEVDKRKNDVEVPSIPISDEIPR